MHRGGLRQKRTMFHTSAWRVGKMHRPVKLYQPSEAAAWLEFHWHRCILMWRRRSNNIWKLRVIGFIGDVGTDGLKDLLFIYFFGWWYVFLSNGFGFSRITYAVPDLVWRVKGAAGYMIFFYLNEGCMQYVSPSSSFLDELWCTHTSPTAWAYKHCHLHPHPPSYTHNFWVIIPTPLPQRR